MSETKVVHVMEEKYDVYIGRPSMWGNPFNVGMDGSREEVIKFFEEYLMGERKPPKHHHWYVPPTKEEIMSLDGCTLGCWCKPSKCHGDVYVSIINRMKAEKFMEAGAESESN